MLRLTSLATLSLFVFPVSAKTLSLECKFTDQIGREITAVFSIDESELTNKEPEGKVYFIIKDEDRFPAVPAKVNLEKPDSKIEVEGDVIKVARVYFDQGERRAFFDNTGDEATVLFDLGDRITGGELKTAQCINIKK